MTQPNDEILGKLHARVVTHLGGRLNQHWLVEVNQQRLVLRRWAQSTDLRDIDYETRLLSSISALGWPVAPIVEGPIHLADYFWTLAPFLPGTPPSVEDPAVEQRARGRLLAEFHASLGQRPEEVKILRWHLDRARMRIAGMPLQQRPDIVVHGDFTPWNLRFEQGRLSGILDFELAHSDHRIADFALSWRGKYDAVIHGYVEVLPLEPYEWALLTPLWWAGLIDMAGWHLRTNTWDDGWLIKKLLERSPLMGADAAAFR